MRIRIAEGESGPQRESVIQPATRPGERNMSILSRELRHLRNIVLRNGLSKCFTAAVLADGML